MRTDTKIIVDDPYVPWFESSGDHTAGPRICVRGYAQIQGQYRNGQDLADALQSACQAKDDMASIASLRQVIPKLDGGWALVAQWPNGHVLASTDRVRTIPLFYANTSDMFVVGVTIDQVCHACDRYAIENEAALEFLLVGYVTGNQTLYRGVKKIQAGQMIEFDPHKDRRSVRENRYYQFYPTHASTASEAQLEEELEHILTSTFTAFRTSCGADRVVVPLSGGFDSRLVAAMLKKVGFENVLCFTYGKPDDQEVLISKKVAQALEFDWRFFEYSGDLWNKWHNSETFWDYCRYCAKGTSKPAVQDFPVVMTLASEGLCGPNTLFYPGHSADTISGSHIPADYQQIESGERPFVDYILHHHFNLWPMTSSQYHRAHLRWIPDKISRLCSPHPGSNVNSPMMASEMWNAEHRQALYIVNSVRTYEFVGSNWRTLWDYDLMDFFVKVPLKYRFGQRLYVNTLRDRIFTDAAAPLARLPIAGLGKWDSRQGLKKPHRTANEAWPQRFRANAKRSVSRLGRLSMSVRKGLWPGAYSRAKVYTRLHGHNLHPRHSTVADALRIFQTLDKLSPELVSIIEPFLGKRPHQVSWWGLFVAIALGEIIAHHAPDNERQPGRTTPNKHRPSPKTNPPPMNP